MTYWKDGGPTLEFVLHTVRLFALGGVEFLDRNQIRSAFNSAPIVRQHPNLFESDPRRIQTALNYDIFSNGVRSFFPLPEMRRNMRSGHMIAFFRPKLFQNGEFRTELVLISTQRDESAAFRFERNFRDCDLHGYSHFQLSPSVKGSSSGFVGTSLPCWLGKYSPVMPLPAVRFSTWFSMLLSLSGQYQKARKGLMRVFDDLDRFGSPESHQKASEALDRILQDLINGEQFVPGTFCSIARSLRLP